MFLWQAALVGDLRRCIRLALLLTIIVGSGAAGAGAQTYKYKLGPCTVTNGAVVALSSCTGFPTDVNVNCASVYLGPTGGGVASGAINYWNIATTSSGDPTTTAGQFAAGGSTTYLTGRSNLLQMRMIATTATNANVYAQFCRP